MFRVLVVLENCLRMFVVHFCILLISLCVRRKKSTQWWVAEKAPRTKTIESEQRCAITLEECLRKQERKVRGDVTGYLFIHICFQCPFLTKSNQRAVANVTHTTTQCHAQHSISVVVMQEVK